MLRLVAYAALTVFAFAVPAQAGERIPKAIAGAVSDPGRPIEDTERDINRKPAEVVAFAGLERGDKVAELLPGKGYFTRIFSKVVGPKGHVYAYVPAEVLKIRPNAADTVKTLASLEAYENTRVIDAPLAQFAASEPLDLVWTSLNYHDFKLPMLGPIDTATLNKAIFAALKPGGVYLVLDHAAAPGSGGRDMESLHRIDPELVVAEVTAAGFVLEARSDILRNPADDHTTKVFHDAVKGKTDQFILKFRKPRVP